MSTDYMRSVRMDWAQISTIESKLEFEVETRDGQRHFGQLAASDENRVLVVSGEQGEVRLPFEEVTKIYQTASRKLGHLDASVSLGFSFAQASDVTRLTLDGRVDRRTRRFLSHLDLVVILSDVEDETFSREELSYTTARHIAPRWNYDAAASFQSNEELGLDRRWLIRAGALRRILETDIRELELGAGLAATREEYTGATPGDASLEGTVSLRYFAFHFDDPELEVSLSLTLFPSLTTSGRLRVELRSDVRRELINDLFWGLSFYESYDSDPVGVGAVSNDLVVTASLGWKL